MIRPLLMDIQIQLLVDCKPLFSDPQYNYITVAIKDDEDELKLVVWCEKTYYTDTWALAIFAQPALVYRLNKREHSEGSEELLKSLVKSLADMFPDFQPKTEIEPCEVNANKFWGCRLSRKGQPFV